MKNSKQAPAQDDRFVDRLMGGCYDLALADFRRQMDHAITVLMAQRPEAPLGLTETKAQA